MEAKMMYRYSATQWIYGNESLETSLKRLQKYGYDGVELAAEPYTTDIAATQKLLDQYGLVVTSLCGIYSHDRDLASPNAEIRSKAVQYVKDSVDMAAALGATHVIVVPNAVGRTRPESTRSEEWEHAVNSVREAGKYAATKNINLAIEAINRFEAYLVINLTTALQFVEEVNVSSVKMMADAFHMNIEERDEIESLKKIAPYLIHIHIADNTREAAGYGNTDFEAMIRTLMEINYQGPLTMEFMPPVGDTYTIAEQGGSGELFDQYTERSIIEMKRIVSKLTEK
jgi:D-psicose/D-tagatose/L-ribulose 3-epimerase